MKENMKDNMEESCEVLRQEVMRRVDSNDPAVIDAEVKKELEERQDPMKIEEFKERIREQQRNRPVDISFTCPKCNETGTPLFFSEMWLRDYPHPVMGLRCKACRFVLELLDSEYKAFMVIHEMNRAICGRRDAEAT